MIVTIEIPDYTIDDGITYAWEDGFEIKTQILDNEIVISANTEGLRSLANHLLNLAQEKVPVGRHMHFDRNNSLDGNSIALVIEKA